MSGQINRGSAAGDFIYEIARSSENKIFVEIGTWNGQGSTKCVMDALVKRQDGCALYSLEADKNFYDISQQYWQERLQPFSEDIKGRLRLIYGSIISENELPSLDELYKSRHWVGPEGGNGGYSNWYATDVRNYNNCPHVLDILPRDIDVLILDGGEFSTDAEFSKLKSRSKIIICDDSSIYKCERIRQQLLEDPTYSVLVDTPDDRNGFCAFRRSQ